MKKILLITLIFIFPFITGAFNVSSKPNSFVSDYAGILNQEESQKIETKISSFEKQTSNEIAVVILKSLEGEDIADVAQQFFEKWGIGKKDKNNGVLLLISLGDRKTRIQTGYGVEGLLTDIATSHIQSDLIAPAFRSGKYGYGIEIAIDKIILLLNGTNPDSSFTKPQTPLFLQKIINNFQLVLFILFIVFQILVSLLAKTKSWWLGGVLGGFFAFILIFVFSIQFITSIIIFFSLVGFGLFFDFLLSRAYNKNGGRNFRGPWFTGGGGFGGGGGGGFSGFGGGSSGGGGSSSSW